MTPLTTLVTAGPVLLLPMYRGAGIESDHKGHSKSNFKLHKRGCLLMNKLIQNSKAKGRVPTQIVFSNSLCFSCVFPVQLQIFPVPVYIICDYYIHKTELAHLPSFWKKKEIFAANIAISFTFRTRELQLEQTKFAVFSLCFGKISKLSVFSLKGIFFGPFPCFPCAVGRSTLKRGWPIWLIQVGWGWLWGCMGVGVWLALPTVPCYLKYVPLPLHK